MKLDNPILRAGLVPTLGFLRYALTIVALLALWWFDARTMNRGFDLNLALIKSVGGWFDGSGRMEAALRAFSAEKMLLFAEISVVVWLLGKALAWPIGRAFQRRSTTTSAPVDLADRRDTIAGPSLTIAEQPTGMRADR